MYMQHLAINRTGNYRKATLNGKEHYVVPMALITPGVLKGSRGSVFYPPEEISRNYDAWNGIPLVVNHPMVNGKPVSARSASILESHGIGIILNAKINSNQKLVAEGWFDIDKTNAVDPRIISAIERGEQIELSTGLFTDNIPVKNSKEAIYNGKQFTHIARNYRPDHLAILPDDLGACSINDGCGVGVLNAAKSKKKKKCAACLAMGSGCNCSPTSNATSMRENAGTLLPAKEKCKGCGKRKSKCECEPVEETTTNELSYSELHVPLEKNLSAKFPGAYLQEVYRDYVIFRYASNLYQIGYSVDKKTDVVSLDSEMPTIVRKVTTFKPVESPEGNAVINSADPLDGLSDTTKAHLILNVGKRKGWTDEARAKAAATRKKKKQMQDEKVVDRSSLLLDDKASEKARKVQAQKDRSRILARTKTKLGVKSTRILREMMDESDSFTGNVFSDEARAAALEARRKLGQAAGAVGKAGKAAVVSGVKAGSKKVGGAFKEIAKTLLGRLKEKLGIKSKPVKMAKDKTKSNKVAKVKAQSRLQKLEARVKANKEARKAKMAAAKEKKAQKKTVAAKVKAVTKRGKENKRSKQVASFQAKKAEKKTAVAKANKAKRNAEVKSKVAAAKASKASSKTASASKSSLPAKDGRSADARVKSLVSKVKAAQAAGDTKLARALLTGRAKY